MGGWGGVRIRMRIRGGVWGVENWITNKYVLTPLWVQIQLIVGFHAWTSFFYPAKKNVMGKAKIALGKRPPLLYQFKACTRQIVFKGGCVTSYLIVYSDKRPLDPPPLVAHLGQNLAIAREGPLPKNEAKPPKIALKTIETKQKNSFNRRFHARLARQRYPGYFDA